MKGPQKSVYCCIQSLPDSSDLGLEKLITIRERKQGKDGKGEGRKGGREAGTEGGKREREEGEEKGERKNLKEPACLLRADPFVNRHV